MAPHPYGGRTFAHARAREASKTPHTAQTRWPESLPEKHPMKKGLAWAGL